MSNISIFWNVVLPFLCVVIIGMLLPLTGLDGVWLFVAATWMGFFVWLCLWLGFLVWKEMRS